MTLQLDTVHHAHLFDLCDQVTASGRQVDMILCDLPYGTTTCAWDEVIPFAPMWERFKQVIKPHGAIVLTASQPFSSALVMSNVRQFRHEWVWEKNAATGHLNANRAPLKAHEVALVFSTEGVEYYPQYAAGQPYRATRGAAGGYVHDKATAKFTTINNGSRFPRSVVRFNTMTGLHPTQKPVALFEYLIRTYTQPDDVVLDPCVGSGTTAIAARNTGRHFIVGDLLPEYVKVTEERLAAPYTLPMLEVLS